MAQLRSLLLACLVAKPVLSARYLEDYGPWLNLKTEPSFRAAILQPNTYPENGTVSGEHIFTTLRTFAGFGPWGPQIFDSWGNLVFYSDAHVGAMAMQDPRPCAYNGEDPPRHICATYPVKTWPAHLEVIPRIYDNSYKEVDSNYKGVGDLGNADGHEFHLLPKWNSFLSTTYVSRHMNITDMDGAKDLLDPYVFDSCFQEIGVKSKEIIFQWCSLDHTKIAETSVKLSDHRMQERPPSHKHPFDYAHINSVDKNKNGDYLISLKFLHQILLVAGVNNSDHAPGSIIWRVGGLETDFRAMSADARFAYQHHARFYPMDDEEEEGTMTISLFDNHCAHHDFIGCDTPSSGKILRLDHMSKTAQLVQSFPHPEGKVSWAGGSLERLRNGNIFISWGQVVDISEFHPETGRLIMHTQLGSSNESFQYRSSRGEWQGNPTWKPKMLAYLRSCDTGSTIESPDTRSSDAKDHLHVYLSWNGATDVSTWRMSASATGEPDSFVTIGEYPQESFETHVEIKCTDINVNMKNATTAGCFPEYFKATAIGKDGKILANGATEATQIFVPGASLLSKGTCTADSCEAGFIYNNNWNTISSCGVESSKLIVTAAWVKSAAERHGIPVVIVAIAVVLGSVAAILWVKGAPKSLPLWNRSERRGWTRIATEDQFYADRPESKEG